MTEPHGLDHDQVLRQSAERLALHREQHTREGIDQLSLSEVRQMLHELRVHQIELEMQNEELRRTQEELAVSRARYLDLYNLAPVGYLSTKEDDVIQEANLTLASLLDVSCSQLVGQRFSRFVYSDDQDAYYLHRKQLLESGEQQVGEMRLIRRSAPPFWARVESSVVRGADGLPHLHSVVSDVPERRRAETALREQKQVLAAILETTLSGYWVWNIAESTAYLSPAFKKMFGYEDEELPNAPETWQKLLFPEDLASVLATFHQHVNHRSRDRYCQEIRCRHKNGSSVWVIRAGRVIDWGADGAPLRMVGCHVDITERKRAEGERVCLQAQLAEAQKLEAVGTLAGGIAHDFNNILNGILGGLSLLELEIGDNSNLQPGIDEMKQLVDRAASLTNALLGFARRGKYDVKALDLARTVETTSIMFGRTRKDIIIEQHVAPQLLWVLMDHAQLEQVLLNLFINASHAMPDGGTLSIGLENAEFSSSEAALLDIPPGHFLRLTVADTGVGMDAVTQSRVFEPFFTTKEVGRGTGLGLASVYGIVKSHQGHIQVESTLGKGTVFSLYLPATEAVPEPAMPPSVVPQTTVTPKTGLILVVDDEEQIRNVCARQVTKLGYQVLSAAGGKEAIELLRQHGKEISLVLLDMTMPDMSGGQTYDAIQEVVPGTKVLLCSGYSLTGQAQAILSRGCNGFLQKPIAMATLGMEIARLL